MSWSLDARIPVHLARATPPDDGDAVLIEGTSTPPGVAAENFVPNPVDHAPNCTCCVARSPAAVALDRLFQRRARGEVAFFRRVVAVTTGAQGDLAVCAALRDDPVAAARFRLESSHAGTS